MRGASALGGVRGDAFGAGRPSGRHGRVRGLCGAVRRVRTGKPPTSAAFPAGAAAGNPHQLRSSPDALKTRGKARYLLRPSSPLAYPLPEHGRTWRSAVFIVKVQLARARSVPPAGQPATRPASARASRTCVDAATGWRAFSGSCNARTPHRPTNTQNGSIHYPLNCLCHVYARCQGGQVV